MIEVLVPRENVNDEVVILQKLIIESGTEVQAGQVVMEIETSKTVIEVAAEESGTILFDVAEGDEIPVGDVLFRIVDGKSDELDQCTDNDISIEDSTEGQVRHISKAAAATAKKYSIDINMYYLFDIFFFFFE